MADPREPLLTCDLCAGEGVRYQSRYGGNDPDVWPRGTCDGCGGSGNKPCADCDGYAVTEYRDQRRPLHATPLCRVCFDARIQEDHDHG